jgi:hypothetical protein
MASVVIKQKPSRQVARVAAGRRKPALSLGILAFLPLLCGFTVYDNLADWQAAVGSYQTEDFESYQPTGFPAEGGQIPLDHFTLEADADGNDEWGSGGIGFGNWSEFYSGPPLGIGFITTLETCDGCGPTYERAIFPQPVSGLFLNVPWTEDGYLGLILGDQAAWGDGYDNANHGMLIGVILDEPLTTIGFDAEHSWAFIDTIYWSVSQPIPEPSTVLLTALGLAIVSFERRTRSRVWK